MIVWKNLFKPKLSNINLMLGILTGRTGIAKHWWQHVMISCNANHTHTTQDLWYRNKVFLKHLHLKSLTFMYGEPAWKRLHHSKCGVISCSHEGRKLANLWAILYEKKSRLIMFSVSLDKSYFRLYLRYSLETAWRPLFQDENTPIHAARCNE